MRWVFNIAFVSGKFRPFRLYSNFDAPFNSEGSYDLSTLFTTPPHLDHDPITLLEHIWSLSVIGGVSVAQSYLYDVYYVLCTVVFFFSHDFVSLYLIYKFECLLGHFVPLFYHTVLLNRHFLITIQKLSI